MQFLDSTPAPERKLKLLAPFYNVFDGEQFIGSVAPMEYGWLAIDTDEEAFAVSRTRADAALALRRNYFPPCASTHLSAPN